MKKIIFVLMLMVMTMAIAACNGSTTNTGATGFIGGTKGLDITFMSGAPPAETSDAGGQSFDVVVDIQNGGETAVDKSKVYVLLSGFSPEAFGVTMESLKANPEDNIEANIKNPDGSVIVPASIPVSFSGFNYVGTEAASMNFPMRAEICYEYTTKASAVLCIKENFNSNKADDICQVNAQREMSTSGAPVQITKLMQSTAGTDKTRFTFTIQNMDTGSIYRSGTVDGCNRASLIDENKVFVQVTGLGGVDDVKCVGLQGSGSAGYVTLTQGQARDVSCTYTVKNRNNRIQPFNIALTYNYWKFVETNIVVQHTPQ
jgi:hypothetical protein